MCLWMAASMMVPRKPEKETSEPFLGRTTHCDMETGGITEK